MDADGDAALAIPEAEGSLVLAEVKLKDRLFIGGTFSPNYAIMCHG
jgi:hypothetical protein